jgi:hypothetical protein
VIKRLTYEIPENLVVKDEPMTSIIEGKLLRNYQ